jgi:2'-5' RNA ligase
VVQSVELVLDAATDHAVRQLWAVLAGAGLPSQASHGSPSNRPHVTLSVAQSVPGHVERWLPDAVGHLPLAVRLDGLVVFGGDGRRVVARLVVPTEALLELQARVSGVMAASPGVVDLTRPGRWTPHVTLARGLTDAELAGALAALGKLPDLDGEAVAVRRWDGDGRREWLVAGDAPERDLRPVPRAGPVSDDGGG